MDTPDTSARVTGRRRRPLVTALLAGVTAVGLAAGGTAIATNSASEAQAGPAAAAGKHADRNEGFVGGESPATSADTAPTASPRSPSSARSPH